MYLLSVERGGERRGLVVVGWDSDYQSKRRLVMQHLSCLKREEYRECLGVVLDYLFRRDPCQEIRVGQLHQQMLDTSVVANKSVKYEVDRQILDHFKAMHFKWKIMNNDKYT